MYSSTGKYRHNIRMLAAILLLACTNSCIMEYESCVEKDRPMLHFKIIMPGTEGKHTRSRFITYPDYYPGADTEEGNNYENKLASLRAMCFYSEGEKDNVLEKSAIHRIDEVPEGASMMEFLLTDLTEGRKKLLLLANEPEELGLDGMITDGTTSLSRLDDLSVNIESLNKPNPPPIPMYAAHGPLEVKGPSIVETGLYRSVAKVELWLNCRYEGVKTVIPAGSSITLTNAMTQTAFFDRSINPPGNNLYKDLSYSVDEDITIGKESRLYFQAYIGDYEKGDVTNLNLKLTLKKMYVTEQGESTLEEKEHIISLSSPQNNHICRNVIYRIKGDVNDFGNFSAEIVDWNTDNVIDTVLGSFEDNTEMTVFPWDEINIEDILYGISADDPWRNMWVIPEGWTETGCNNNIGFNEIPPGYGVIDGFPSGWGDNGFSFTIGKDDIYDRSEAEGSIDDWNNNETSNSINGITPKTI